MGKDLKTKALFDKYYDLYKKSGEKKLAKVIGFKEKINIKKNGDCPLSNLLMDAIRNITGADLSIVNFWMFQNYLSPGYLSILDFIKLIPHENHICVTGIKGSEIKKMIKAVQKGERGFQPTSGLKQFVKINKKTNKKCQSGTIIISFTKRVGNLNKDWELKDGFRRVMSWGIASIYIHRRK